MWRKVLVSALAVLPWLSAASQAQTGLVAWYKLDEGSGTLVLDSSVNGNHGVIHREAGYTTSPCAGGTAIQQLAPVEDHPCSSGRCGYVRVEDSPSLNFGTGDFTIEAWIRFPQGVTNQAIAQKNGGAWQEYGLGLSSPDGPPFDRVYFEIAGQDPFAERPIVFGETHVDDGQWHQVAAVRQGTTIAVFLDGYRDGLRENIPTLDVNNDMWLCLGCGNSGDNPRGFFAGEIDEIKIWSRALDPSEFDVSCGPDFVRGDANADGSVRLCDVAFLLTALFPRERELPCQDAADANDDSVVDRRDVLYLLRHLFRIGPPPSDPFPLCGADPTADKLSCDSFPSCE
jgi:hypothetical protein